ncbi:MAG: hypothetical protein HKL95_04065 [Phycisphaerae bacterium]|nr:hypothetical protein [Phycisphaerae bacterium]
MSHFPTDASPPAARPRRRVWLAILAILCIGLIFILVAAWLGGLRLLNSASAHQWVLNRLQTRIGLRVQVKSIHIRWTGTTTMRNVRIAMPLHKHAFAIIPKLVFHHHNVLWILLTGELGLKALIATSPRLTLRRDSTGDWNLPTAWRDIRTAWQAGSSHANSISAWSTNLPAIIIHQGAIQIDTLRPESLTIPRISFFGQPDGPITWKFSLAAGSPGPKSTHTPNLQINGVLVPAQSWRHHIQLRGRHLAQWIRALRPGWTSPTNVRATLRGALSGITLHDKITHAHIRLGTTIFGGTADLTYSGSSWLVSAEKVRLDLENIATQLQIYRGQLWADRQGWHLADMHAQVAGGGLRLAGVFNPTTESATLDAAWNNISLLHTYLNSGHLMASLSSPWLGHRLISATIATSGRSRYGRWRTHLTLAAHGAFHTGMRWRLIAPVITWRHRHTLTLNKVHATGTINRAKITVAQCSLAEDPHLQLNGRYHFRDHLWNLFVRSDTTAIPVLPLPAHVHLQLRASGRGVHVQLDQLLLKSRVWSLAATGQCILADQYPAHLQVTATNIPLVNHSPGTTSAWALGGLISGTLLMRGNLRPPDLSFTGRLNGTHFTVNRHLLALPPVHATGRISHGQISISAAPVKVLGGQLQVKFLARTSGALAGLTLHATHISARRTVALLLTSPPEGIRGHLGLNLHIVVPSRNLSKAVLRGRMTSTNLLIPSLNAHLATIAIHHAVASLHYARGTLKLDPITISSGTATALCGVKWSHAQPADILFHTRLNSWTFRDPIEHLTLNLSGESRGTFNWKTSGIYGTGTINMAIFHRNLPLSHATLQITGTGHAITATRLVLSAGQNTLTGHGTWNINHPLASTAVLKCHLPNPQILLPNTSWTRILTGSFSGNLWLGHATSPHPLGPMELQLHLAAHKASLGAIPIGNLGIRLFVNKAALVMDQATLAFADGHLRLWASVTRHQKTLFSTDAALRFSRINLDELTRTVLTKARPTPGLLSGQVTAVALSNHWQDATGSGSLRIIRSNLAGTTILSSIYRLLNVQLSKNNPTGSGEAKWRIDGGNAEITSLRYFNRGTEIIGSGRLSHLWKMPDCQLHGYVVGTVRPFKRIHIPFVPQAQAILNALESSVSTVQVSGTWKHPTTTPVVFKNLGRDIQDAFINAIVGRPSTNP